MITTRKIKSSQDGSHPPLDRDVIVIMTKEESTYIFMSISLFFHPVGNVLFSSYSPWVYKILEN